MNAQQLEAQSELQRREIENTIGELRRRLSPGQLVDELLAYTKDGGGQFLSNLGRQATANPLPVTLMGAGLTWLLLCDSQNAQSASSSAGKMSSDEERLRAGDGNGGASTSFD